MKMISLFRYIILGVIAVIYFINLCKSEPVIPLTLVVYSPGDPEYTDVLVKQEHDNLTLVCELRGDSIPRSYVWNYVNNGTTGQRPYVVEPAGPTTSSSLLKHNLQLSDSGQYMCSAPPFSVTKYILVQTKAPKICARGAFWCGARCVLAAYVCDGMRDCVRGEDEAADLCDRNVCARSDKLNCSSGRCISMSACCRGHTALCRQPACCDEYPMTSQLGYPEEYPALFEDRRAPDDYGFIQSTIYTVTACALIFMIAVVLLVSAICKMHMKRAALRGYSSAERAARDHYTSHYAQTHRFPPCYEASRLLEENRTGASPPHSPDHAPPAAVLPDHAPQGGAEGAGSAGEPRGLARLSAIFSSRYRQVPSSPPPVELVSVPASPALRPPAPLHPYRSPAYQGDADFIFTSAETGDLGRDLNYMATPIECFRRRALRRNTLERVMDQLDRQRMTLQLGRFQVSLPRLGRPRADTPDVPPASRAGAVLGAGAEEAYLVRDDTYTLNGRTIRLLGAEFDNYPPLPDDALRPPSYTEAVRYKLYGPPPEYLSRDGLNRTSLDVDVDVDVDVVDREADTNVELPPGYDDLTGADDDNGNNGNGNERNTYNGDDVTEEHRLNAATNVVPGTNLNSSDAASLNDTRAETFKTFSSIIDNLPAIDSDVNANDTDIVINNGNDVSVDTVAPSAVTTDRPDLNNSDAVTVISDASNGNVNVNSYSGIEDNSNVVSNE